MPVILNIVVYGYFSINCASTETGKDYRCTDVCPKTPTDGVFEIVYIKLTI